MKIITNNQPREVLSGHELTEKERKEHDYIDWEAVARGEEGVSFFRYKGELYDINEATGIPPLNSEHGKWLGIIPETYFSGIIFRYGRDTDEVIVGRYST
jgi:hypothetical protein